MSTVAQKQPSSSFLPSPHSPSMDEFFDLSAFGSSSSRESSPIHLPTTPELNDNSAAFTADPFYQSFYAASAAANASQAQADIGALMSNNTTFETMKDATTDSWNSYSHLLSPSLFGSSSLPGESTAAGTVSIEDMALFSSSFAAATAAPGSSGVASAAAVKGGVFGSPPLSAMESSPGSSPSTSFALEPTDSNASTAYSGVPTFGHPSFAIDPQLVAAPSAAGIMRNSGANISAATSSSANASSSSSPAATLSSVQAAGASLPSSRTQPTARAVPHPGSYNEDDEEDDDEDDEDDDGDMKSISRSSLPPVGKGAKNATARKSASGIVQMGGITKQRVTSAVVALDKDPNDTEDWRPTPEEYKKLSSKEKRQLRNKISARNFRVRRKEYITTLESHIADRDRLIEAIRQELGASKIENDELRQEVDALKRAMLEGRATAESLALPPPAPLDANGDVIRPISPISPTGPPPLQQQSRNSSSAAKLNKPNMRKDIATPNSPAFWGGVGAFGGVTPVHATLIPDITLPPTPNTRSSVASVSPTTSELLSGKLASSSWGSGWWAPQQENINPRLNMVPSMFNSPHSSDSELDNNQRERDLFAKTNAGLLNNNGGFPGMTRFDAFMELNPFTIKSADDYKMHLWAQMAASRQHQQFLSQQTQQQQQPSQRFAQPGYAQQQPQQNSGSSSSLLNAMRPSYFQSAASSSKTESPQSPKSTLAALLSGKALASTSLSSTYPTPPTSPRARPATTASSSSGAPAPTQQQAFAAALASQTLLSRMSSAFWDAFSGSTTHSGSSIGGMRSAPSWDAEKVRKVLDGRAVVRVVDVDPVIDEKEGLGLGLGLEEKMRGLSLRK